MPWSDYLSNTRVNFRHSFYYCNDTHLKIALNCIDEGFICHNLCVSFEKRLEAVLSGLQLLLGDLQGEIKKWINVKIQICGLCKNLNNIS